MPAASGPLGALGQSATTDPNIAVDPDLIVLAAPLWVEIGESGRSVIARDTGSAIKGAQCADVFRGTGVVAGDCAGRMRDSGRWVTLLPPDRAARSLV